MSALSEYKSSRDRANLVRVLWFFLGGLGAHRFACGRLATGSLQLLLTALWIFLAIYGVVESFNAALGRMEDFITGPRNYFISHLLVFTASIVWWIIDYFIVVQPISKSAQ